MAEFKDLFRVPAYFIEGVRYHLAGKLFTAKPRMVQFPVCDRCNARCMMCNRWQKETKEEISLDKVREVFGNTLFSKVEDISLHGGEPTLRRDLAGICKVIQDSCPRLKRIWISTNGFGPRRIEERVGEIIKILDFDRLAELGVNVSIDGLEETHDRIRGVKGGFKQSLETIQMLQDIAKNYPVSVSMGTVVQPMNLGQIDEIEQLAGGLGVPVFFQPLMFDKFFNIADDSGLRFGEKDRGHLKDVIVKKFAQGFSSRSFYWCDFLSMMNGAKRKSPCAFDRYVLSLYPTGEILPCSQEDWILFGNVYEQPVDRIWFSDRAKAVRRRMKKEVCPTCSSYCGIEFSTQKEFFGYLLFYLRRGVSRLFSR